MNPEIIERLPAFLETIGLDTPPMGVFFTDQEPADGFSPDPQPPISREKEAAGQVDWPAVFSAFSCMMKNVWLSRKKGKPAFFTAERFGCPGCAFWAGFTKPQAETIIRYVSDGVPGRMEGEHYCKSFAALSATFDAIDPVPAPKPVCVVKPLSSFTSDETPLLTAFFARPEPLCGLHQLAFFVTEDPEVCASPWGPGCGSLVTWPLKYLAAGQTRAVLGGWDPSARRYYRKDEISFTVPFSLFESMLEEYEGSFLMTKTWGRVKKKMQG